MLLTGGDPSDAVVSTLVSGLRRSDGLDTCYGRLPWPSYGRVADCADILRRFAADRITGAFDPLMDALGRSEGFAALRVIAALFRIVFPDGPAPDPLTVSQRRLLEKLLGDEALFSFPIHEILEPHGLPVDVAALARRAGSEHALDPVGRQVGVARLLRQQMGQPGRSLQELDSIHPPPADARWWLERGRVLACLGTEGALEAFDHAIALEPGDGDAHFERAGWLINARQAQAALASAAEANAHMPEEPAAARNHALALKLLGRPAERLAILEAAVARVRDSADLWEALAFARASTADLAGAVAALDECVCSDADHATGYYNRACYRVRVGLHGQACEDVESAADRDPALVPKMAADSDLEPIRTRPAVARLLS